MKINLSPYIELESGPYSIYDYVDPSFVVDDQVITYLKVGHYGLACPGAYNHPFEHDKIVLGPYRRSDGDKYIWDYNLWEYVTKYHVKLPKDFIEHAMSTTGLKFIVENIDDSGMFSQAVTEYKKRKASEMLAWHYAVTGTEQRIKYVGKWNGYYVYEYILENPWANHGLGSETRVHFVLVKNGVPRFEKDKELDSLIMFVGKKQYYDKR